MAEPQTIEVLRTKVQREWVDYNNHLRDAYYLVIFSLGIDAFMEQIHMGEIERQRTKTTIYTLEAHLNFQREVKEAEVVNVKAQVMGYDQKRIHLFMSLHVDRLELEPAATSEFMLLNVDNSGEPRSAPFRPEVSDALARLWSEHKSLPKPKNSGRAIALPQR